MKNIIEDVFYWILIIIACIVLTPLVIVLIAACLVAIIVLAPFALLAEAFSE